MPKSARIDLRIDPDLKARVEALAAERGQTLTVFVERALEAAVRPPLKPSAEAIRDVPGLGKGFTPPRPKAGR